MYRKSSDFNLPWRNSHAFKKGMYQQLCRPDELISHHPKLWKIIQQHGEAFDDEWYYWLSKTGRYVRRTPLWLGKKRIAVEDHSVHRRKHRKFEPNKKIVQYMGCSSAREEEE